jgi:hypothetical protein
MGKFEPVGDESAQDDVKDGDDDVECGNSCFHILTVIIYYKASNE